MENIEYIVESFIEREKTFYKHTWKKGRRTETIILHKDTCEPSIERLALEELKKVK